MKPASWMCPHCRTSGPVEPEDASLRRCQGCGFVYPVAWGTSLGTVSDELEELTATESEPWAAVRADRYTVLRALGAGAQGRLLLARDKHLNQPCVLKVLRRTKGKWAEAAIARLKNEAYAGAAVNHPAVARVFDCDCVDGCWYFVMEYVEGHNLRNIIRSVGPMHWQQAAHIGTVTADGLAAIHEAGLIHRDVKPSNLMLRTDGRVKIMDLGLVKVQTADPDLAVTRAGQLLGTPYYMAPEQFDAEGKVGHQTDIYGLGATLYHLVAGRPPFEGTGVLDVAQKHRHDPVVWSEETAARVPSWYRQVVDACLAKRPEHRHPSAAAVAEALRSGEMQPGRSHVAVESASKGVTVMAFRNISGREEDEWVGEAFAECLTNRLMQLEGIHLADRTDFARMLDRSPAAGESGPDNEQILEAARMVGAGSVVAGGFQRMGENLRITAHLLSAGQASPSPVASVSGRLEELFALEDTVGDKLVELIGSRFSPVGRRRASAGGTANLEAMEKFIRGRRAFADGDYHEAIKLGEQAQALDPEYLEPISFIGACYARLGEYDRAMEYHQRQERLARELDDQPRLAEALSNIGVMYYYKGEYPLAYEFLDRAKTISLELGLHSEAAKYRGNLGFILMRLDRFDEAEAAFAEAIEVNKRLGDLVSLQWPYNGMGGVLLKQDRVTEAREHYHRALTLAEEIGDRVNTGISHMNLGKCACLLEQFGEASARFNAALAALEGTDFWNGLTLVYEQMAEMHLQMSKFTDALAAVDRRIDLARRHGNNRMEAEAWEQKARAYEQMGRTEQAIHCLKHSVEVSQRPAPYESLHVYLEEVSKRPAFH